MDRSIVSFSTGTGVAKFLQRMNQGNKSTVRTARQEVAACFYCALRA
jgi:hypothetical protein